MSLWGAGIAVFVFAILVFLHGTKDVPLNILILNFSDTFFYCVVILLAVWIFRLIKKPIIRNKNFYILWCIFFVLSIPHIPVLFKYETTQIGDFYEAREYTEKYYVLMSREPEKNVKRKVYTLPAEIERRYDYEGTTDIRENWIGQEYGGKEVYSLGYHINYLYFPNGGYLKFDYELAYGGSELTLLIPNKEAKVRDYKDETYYITLTERKAVKY